MEEIDELTIKAAAGRASGAFRRIYDHYSSFVWSVIYQTTNGDIEAAKEVMQDTFVRLNKSLSSYRNDAAFSTWLYRIAWNASMSFMARRRRERERFASFDGELVEEGARDDRVEQREMAHRVLSVLSADERFLLVAREVHGFSFQELAGITGRSEGALRTQLHRVRGEIRRAVDYER